MNNLVTGATGFVGDHLVKALLARGERVRILKREAGPTPKHVEVFTGDVTKPESLVAALQEVDTVYHLAGVVGYSRAARAQMAAVNVDGTRHVLEAMRAHAPRAKLIYMSSVVAVGASFDGAPLTETSPFNVHPLDLGYFETKKAAEDLVVSACRAGDVEAVILNPSTIYGAADAKKGSRRTQLKVARGNLPFYTRGGVSVVSVHDVVPTLITARERGQCGERYILSGENITIKDLFNRIARFAGVDPPSIYLPDLAVKALGHVGDALEAIGKKGPLNSENAWTAILFHWFDHTKATRELGFNPRPADVALKESVDWMKQQGWLGVGR